MPGAPPTGMSQCNYIVAIIVYICILTTHTNMIQLEEIQQQQIHYQEEYSNLQQQYTELQSRTHTPAVIPLHSTVVSNTIQADEPVSSETLDAYDFGIPPQYDDNFNINDYISAPPVDVSTQIGASEFLEQSTQYPYINDPDYFPCEQACQTNAQDYLYPTEHYLETLFRDFIEESQTHIPESHAHILCNSRGVEDSTKEPYSRWVLLSMCVLYGGCY